jgi:NhaP-type Na+/H+ or K+/H+ antiporter
VLGAFVLAYALVARRLQAYPVSGPILFVAFGLLMGPKGLDWIAFPQGRDTIRIILETSLALVLFSDASRIDVRAFRREAGLPGRLLGIGLPLTIAAGAGAAALLFHEASFAEAAVLAAVLAPTDAALGLAVVSNPIVPASIRQALNVESGLNDGIVLPVLLVLLTVADVNADPGERGMFVRTMFEEIGWGLAIGVIVGLVGGWLLMKADEGDRIGEMWRGLAVLAVPFVAYTVAAPLGGSGFIATFVAGVAFGRMVRSAPDSIRMYTEETAQLLTLVTFVIFGGVFLTAAWGRLTWQVAVYALLSLTVIRIVPVAISLIGTKAAPPTVLFLGWFGPRGLASVLFAVLVVTNDVVITHLSVITLVSVWTITASVLLHGVTAVPVSNAYGRWFSRQAETGEEAAELPEAKPVTEHALRRGWGVGQ